MNPTVILGYFWKLPVCGLGCVLGMLLSGVSLHALGFPTPVFPSGIDAGPFATWLLVGSMILAFGLSFISHSLQLNWLARWIILEELIWVFCVAGIVLSSSLLMKAGLIHTLGNGLYTALNFLLPSLFLTSLVAILFLPRVFSEPRLMTFFATHEIREKQGN